MMAVSQALLEKFESAVQEILKAFEIEQPPVPIELMLQRPREGLWEKANLSEISVSFLNMRDPYAPRMSAVRLLVRNIARSEWGAERGLSDIIEEGEQINAFARAIIMPKQFIDSVDKSAIAEDILSIKFEVPERDVLDRLNDLGYEVSS